MYDMTQTGKAGCCIQSELQVVVVILPVTADEGLHAAHLLRNAAKITCIVQGHVQDLVGQPVNLKVSSCGVGVVHSVDDVLRCNAQCCGSLHNAKPFLSPVCCTDAD